MADLLHSPLLQKIMHTRKRHQDMFQDLNRKLQHAEKEKESPPVDSKVSLVPFRAVAFDSQHPAEHRDGPRSWKMQGFFPASPI